MKLIKGKQTSVLRPAGLQAVRQHSSYVQRIYVQVVLSMEKNKISEKETKGGSWAERVKEGTGGGTGTRQKVHRLKPAVCIFGSCFCRTT